jgi:hypothetical protein
MEDKDREPFLAGNDRALAPLLLAADESARTAALEVLLTTNVQPLINRILSRYQSSFSSADAEDLASSVALRLVRRLCRADHLAQRPIADINSYAAKLTYNVIYDLLRRRHPETAKLRTRLRYLLSHDSRFAIWESPAGVTCGLANDRGTLPVRAERMEQQTHCLRDMPSRADALETLFIALQAGLLLDDLVAICADAWNIVEQSLSPMVDAASASRDALHGMEARQYLVALWNEIRELRQSQRQALLLNLRDEQCGNALSLLLISGVAGFDEISEVLGLTPARCASIWNDLPVDDLTIGSMLGVSRQQVINLRKAARQRLERRLSSFRTERQ